MAEMQIAVGRWRETENGLCHDPMTGLDKAMTIIAIMFDGNETARQPHDHPHQHRRRSRCRIAALIAADPRWSAIVARTGRPPLRRREGGFAGLAQIIVSQQVSVASAAAIHGRLVRSAIRSTTTRAARAQGQAAARRPVERKGQDAEGHREGDRVGAIDLHALADMPADERMRRWSRCTASAHGPPTSICSACIGHADAWPAATSRCRKRARLAFGSAERPTTQGEWARSRTMAPYRAVAARLLWSYYRVDEEPRRRAQHAAGQAAPKPAKRSERHNGR
jgi:DNA-3-methyladenine glycosylase II